MSATEDPLSAEAAKWARRNRTFATAAAAALLALIAGFAFYLVELTAARRHAEERLADALVAQGRARAEASRWSDARASFEEALRVREQVGGTKMSAELGLSRASLHAPPPLYTLESGAALAAVAFLGDGSRFVSGGDALEVREVATGVRVAKLELGATAKVTHLEVTRDGRSIVALADDNVVRVFDAASFALTASMRAQKNYPLLSLAVSADARTVFCGDEYGNIQRFELASGKYLSPDLALKLPATALAVSRDGNLLVAAAKGRLAAWFVDGSSAPVSSAIPLSGAPSDLDISTDTERLLFASGVEPAALVVEMRKLGDVTDWTNASKVVLTGHSSALASAELSRDGTLALTADHSGRVIVWDALSGSLRRSFETGTGARVTAAFSPDASLVISAGARGELQLWKTAELPLVVEHKGAPMPVLGSVFVAGGKSIAHADMAGIALSELRTRVLTARIAGVDLGAIEDTIAMSKEVPRLLRRLAFSADGRSAVLKRQLGGSPLELITLPGGEQVRTFDPPEDTVYGLTISRDGRYVLAASFLGGSKTGLVLFDTQVAGPKPVRTIGERIYTAAEGALAFSPDARFAVAGGTENKKIEVAQKTASVWSLADGKLVRELRGHEAPISSVLFTPGGAQVLTGSHDRTVRLWDVATGTVAHVFRGEPSGISAIAISPDGKLLATGSELGVVRLWEVASGAELESWPVHAERVDTLEFSPDGASLISGTARGANGWFELDRASKDVVRRRAVDAALTALARDPGDAAARGVLAEWYASWDEKALACVLLATAPGCARAAGTRAVGAGAGARDHRGRSPLHVAALNGEPAKVRALLDAGADPNARSEDKRTPLMDAALRDRTEVAHALLAKGADPNATNDEGLSPLIAAAQNGHAAMVKLLVAGGADPNTPVTSRLTALQKVAAVLGDAEGESMVELLVSLGADIDRLSSNGQGALHYAVDAGHERIVEKLLALKAKVDDADASGKTPLFLAVERRRGRIASMLLAAGANAGAGTRTEKPLHLAVKNGDLDLVTALLDHGADLDSTAADGTTPLTRSVLADQTSVTLALLHRGADPTKKDDLGRSPLVLLIENDGTAMLRAIASRGVDLAAVQDAGVGLLEIAVRKRKLRAIEEILLATDRTRASEAIAKAKEEAKRLGFEEAEELLSL